MTRTIVTAGDDVSWFASTHCVHVKGQWAGEPVVFEAWQQDFVDELFEINPATGLRIYTEGLLGIPRKNGKSLLAAVLGHYLLTMDAERGAEIVSAAGSKDQARVVHNVARSMGEKSPRLRDLVRVMRNAIICDATDGTWLVVASNADLQQGSNPSGYIVDEYHVHKTDELKNALDAGTGARQQPLGITITTAGSTKSRPLRELYDNALKSPTAEIEQRGEYLTIVRDRAAGFLMYWYAAPPDADISDPAVMKGANPASWITVEYLQKQLAKPSMREAHFRRYHLNQWVDDEQTGIKPDEWDALKRRGFKIPDGSTASIGIDIGYRHDWSAVVATAELEGGEVGIEAHLFEPPEGEGEELDIEATVEVAVFDLMKRLRVTRISLDPMLATVLMQRWVKRRLPVFEFPQTQGRMAVCSVKLLSAIRKRQLVHDGDLLLRAHVLNMIEKDLSGRAWRFDKPKDDSQKIDAGIALMLSLDGLDQGDDSNPYQDRGLLIL